MKNLILGFAICTLAFACKSNDKAAVTSPEGASAPEASCCESKAGCSDAAKAGCDASAKADCGAKTECSSAKVCPVTGKPIEN